MWKIYMYGLRAELSSFPLYHLLVGQLALREKLENSGTPIDVLYETSLRGRACVSLRLFALGT